MSWVAYNKVRKPATHTIDDLMQEAKMAAIRAIQSWDPDMSSNCSLSSWIYTIVTRHLHDIVWYTYRKIIVVDFEDFQSFLGSIADFSESGLEFYDWFKTKFSTIEKNYIACCLEEKCVGVAGFRNRVRARMDITEKYEDILRETIKQTILEEKAIEIEVG
jgi:hypothetical protein